MIFFKIKEKIEYFNINKKLERFYDYLFSFIGNVKGNSWDVNEKRLDSNLDLCG